MTVELKEREVAVVPTREEAKAQFEYWTKKLDLKHTFSFDEAYDYCLEKRRKEKLKDFRSGIVKLEDRIKSLPNSLGADPFPLKHTFADGMYIRQITVPAKVLTVTKIHAKEHPFFLLKGTISILTEEGIKKFTAPYSGITKSGTKRIIYHHDEVVLTTVHRTDETDIEKIEAEVTAKSFDELDNIIDVKSEEIVNFLEEVKKGEE